MTFFCKTIYKSCENEECWVGKPKWLFNLNGIFEKHYTEEYKIDEEEKEIRINGSYTRLGSLSVDDFGNSAPLPYSYAKADIYPEKIYIKFYKNKGCFGVNCEDINTREISVDRVSGEFITSDLHTDGTIKNIPLGKPYFRTYGYCDSHIERLF